MWKINESSLRVVTFLCLSFTGVILLCAICVLVTSARVYALVYGMQSPDGNGVEVIYSYPKILIGVSSALCLIAPFGSYATLTKRPYLVVAYTILLFSMSVTELDIGHKSFSRRPDIQRELERGMIQAYNGFNNEESRSAVEKLERTFGCVGIVSTMQSYGCLNAVLDQYTIVVWIVVLVGSLQLLGALFSSIHVVLIVKLKGIH